MEANSITEMVKEIAPGIKFKSAQHRSFFVEMVEKTRAEGDTYRKSFFYTLGILPETRAHIESLYDFENNCTDLNGFNEGWQTGGTIKMCRLAFNLYNGFMCNCTICGDLKPDTEGYFTPYELFATPDAFYMLEAVKVRYPQYTRIQELLEE